MSTQLNQSEPSPSDRANRDVLKEGGGLGQTDIDPYEQ